MCRACVIHKNIHFLPSLTYNTYQCNRVTQSRVTRNQPQLRRTAMSTTVWALMEYDVQFYLDVVQEYLDDSKQALQIIEDAISKLNAELDDLEVEYASLYSIPTER